MLTSSAPRMVRLVRMCVRPPCLAFNVCIVQALTPWALQYADRRACLLHRAHWYVSRRYAQAVGRTVGQSHGY